MTGTGTAQAARKILLANPRGFCAGVDRAIDSVNRLLETYGPPVYVRKEIVHNRVVVERLRQRGAIFVEDVDEVPRGAVAVFSAHGVSPAVRQAAAARDLRIVDATCPLVTKVHREAIAFAKDGMHVLLVGHRDHDEVVGTMGEIPGQITLVETVEQAETVTVPDPERVGVVTQTTLSLDDTRHILDRLRLRFPKLALPARDDICYATQNRQEAVQALALRSDVVLVVGSENSSNTLRLRDCARQTGVPAYLIDDPARVERGWIDGRHTIGVTAGASTSEDTVQEVVDRICTFGSFVIEQLGEPEPEIVFAPPPVPQ
ncbi:MAG: 4-hydroxy-3-methylbut-2-enyl diphosphate reductase [Vulcanimicrobiaceae bacterium]